MIKETDPEIVALKATIKKQQLQLLQGLKLEPTREKKILYPTMYLLLRRLRSLETERRLIPL